MIRAEMSSIIPQFKPIKTVDSLSNCKAGRTLVIQVNQFNCLNRKSYCKKLNAYSPLNLQLKHTLWTLRYYVLGDLRLRNKEKKSRKQFKKNPCFDLHCRGNANLMKDNMRYMKDFFTVQDHSRGISRFPLP
ncbi:uncharacterized protein LOC141889698 [Acropora palmata]|uniref:uncharacterized protein LOC141889698 n=1 Tax=Acropora palmata TaxID=6131 RepID=UPI003D9FB63C